MDWSLNDPEFGFYSTGQVSIGEKGDFVTSPSLSNDFAQLLAAQLAQWFKKLEETVSKDTRLSLIEFGPGDGNLSFDLIDAFETICPELLSRLQLILVECNRSMIERQKKSISSKNNIQVLWKSFDDLSRSPVVGILISNEGLDVLPVERIILRDGKLKRLGVELLNNGINSKLRYKDLSLTEELKSQIYKASRKLGISIPPAGALDGWCSEWHIDLKPWFHQASRSLEKGHLLIIDYAMEAKRYYSQNRSKGSMLAYKNQVASQHLLTEPGSWDLTSHLCIETLILEAEKNQFKFIGEARQGQALLALGLAERLSSLQVKYSNNLSEAFRRREALLRLVDPLCLGEFRWLAFDRSSHCELPSNEQKLETLFLKKYF